MFKQLTKRDAGISIESITNGFVFTVGGRSEDGDWITEKVHVGNVDELLMAVRDIMGMPVDD
jgi:hypothetical protein